MSEAQTAPSLRGPTRPYIILGGGETQGNLCGIQRIVCHSCFSFVELVNTAHTAKRVVPLSNFKSQLKRIICI